MAQGSPETSVIEVRIRKDDGDSWAMRFQASLPYDGGGIKVLEYHPGNDDVIKAAWQSLLTSTDNAFRLSYFESHSPGETSRSSKYSPKRMKKAA